VAAISSSLTIRSSRWTQLSEPKRVAANQWFLNTVLSRLDDKRTGAIVIVMQRGPHGRPNRLRAWPVRRHGRCLSLRRLQKASKLFPDHGPATPAATWLCPFTGARTDGGSSSQLRLQLGSEPVFGTISAGACAASGAMIKRHWVQRYPENPGCRKGELHLQSWDTALKGGPDNDWSVCTTSAGTPAISGTFSTCGAGGSITQHSKPRSSSKPNGGAQLQVLIAGSQELDWSPSRTSMPGTGHNRGSNARARQADPHVDPHPPSLKPSRFIFQNAPPGWLNSEAELFAFPGSRA